MLCIYTPRMTVLLVAKVRQSLIALHIKDTSCTEVSAECQTVDPFAKVKPNSIPSKSIKRESDRGSRDRYSRKTIGMLLSRVGRAQKGQITAEAELGKRYEELQGIRRIKRI